MQPLFAGKTFSTVMTERIAQMQKEIEKLKCADVEGIDEKGLSAKAEKLAEKYVPRDIPNPESSDLSKGESVNGVAFWQLPFHGSVDYFNYMPVASLPPSESNHFVEKIENGNVYFLIDGTSDTARTDAENRANKTVQAIEKCLGRMRQDADELYNLNKLKEAAILIFKKKQDSCAKLRSLGYAVR
jgi:hypothetical protein